MSADKTAIRDAAAVIVLRHRWGEPSVLMGRRQAGAAFMPRKFVFPGGAVDAADFHVPLAQDISEPCAARLRQHVPLHAPQSLARALVATAVRELWEETGQILGACAPWANKGEGKIPQAWQSFAAQGYVPSGQGLQFVFRAITPPGRPRRFDARFFLLDAGSLASNADDFSQASDELSHLQWVPLHAARRLDLPFITEVVLTEVEGRLHKPAPPASVPFFCNTDEGSHFKRLHS